MVLTNFQQVELNFLFNLCHVKKLHEHKDHVLDQKYIHNMYI